LKNLTRLSFNGGVAATIIQSAPGHVSDSENRKRLERPALDKLQLQRLQDTVRRVAEQVPFYQKKFAELCLKPGDIRSLTDLRRLPFTTKRRPARELPGGLLAVPYDATSACTLQRHHRQTKALFFSRQDVENAPSCARARSS